MAATHPILTALIVVILVIIAVLLIRKLYGYLGLIIARARQWRTRSAAPPPGSATPPTGAG
jgi:hypothetical protein